MCSPVVAQSPTGHTHCSGGWGQGMGGTCVCPKLQLGTMVPPSDRWQGLIRACKNPGGSERSECSAMTEHSLPTTTRGVHTAGGRGWAWGPCCACAQLQGLPPSTGTVVEISQRAGRGCYFTWLQLQKPELAPDSGLGGQEETQVAGVLHMCSCRDLGRLPA